MFISPILNKDHYADSLLRCRVVSLDCLGYIDETPKGELAQYLSCKLLISQIAMYHLDRVLLQKHELKKNEFSLPGILLLLKICCIKCSVISKNRERDRKVDLSVSKTIN